MYKKIAIALECCFVGNGKQLQWDIREESKVSEVCLLQCQRTLLERTVAGA
jgi:hypothetical protein